MNLIFICEILRVLLQYLLTRKKPSQTWKMHWSNFNYCPFWVCNPYVSPFVANFSQINPYNPQIQTPPHFQLQREVVVKEEVIANSAINENQPEITRSKPIQKKSLRKSTEEQYLPPNKLTKRNKNSNVLKLFIRHVKKLFNKTNTLRDIIKSRNLTKNLEKEFISQFNKIFIQCRNYARPTKIKLLMRKKESFSMILRILFRQFYKTQIYKIILRKSTLTKKNKIEYIKICKKLAKQLIQ